MPGPAVNDVTTISSNDRAKDSKAPAMTAERTAGKVTKRKVCHVDAPRSIDASCNDRPVRRNRAATLLNTTTMQKVAWPSTTVSRPNEMPSGFSTVRNAEFSAMPVTIPGSAIGRMTTRLSESRPNQRKSTSATENIEPSTIAIAVAPSPALTLVSTALRTPSLMSALCHHDNVQPRGGHEKTLETLKELTRTTISGT